MLILQQTVIPTTDFITNLQCHPAITPGLGHSIVFIQVTIETPPIQAYGRLMNRAKNSGLAINYRDTLGG